MRTVREVPPAFSIEAAKHETPTNSSPSLPEAMPEAGLEPQRARRARDVAGSLPQAGSGGRTRTSASAVRALIGANLSTRDSRPIRSCLDDAQENSIAEQVEKP